jgi:hypothetical protein
MMNTFVYIFGCTAQDQLLFRQSFVSSSKPLSLQYKLFYLYPVLPTESALYSILSGSGHSCCLHGIIYKIVCTNEVDKPEAMSAVSLTYFDVEAEMT